MARGFNLFRRHRSEEDDDAHSERTPPQRMDDSEQQQSQLCAICFDSMNTFDTAHPIMCSSNQCTYNFCSACAETLYEEEDVNCPNCRSDLRSTISDTVLLRKIDDPDDIDMKKLLDVDVKLLQEIADARFREAKFMKLKDDGGNAQTDESRDDPTDEWGIEVDTRVGPHESIKLPREQLSPFYFSSPQTDTTLLAGFESLMTHQDKDELTQSLTSGDTAKLAQAAQVLDNIAQSVTQRRPLTNQDRPWSKRALIYKLIQDGKRARSSSHQQQQSHNKYQVSSSSSSSNNERRPTAMYNSTSWDKKSYAVKAAQHKIMDRQVRQQKAFLRQFPLPARMPKFAVVGAGDIELTNDTWDGTVQDAFRKIYVQASWNSEEHSVSKSPENVGKILTDTVRIDTDHPRVVVSKSKVTGIFPGDVLTHVNGVELRNAKASDIRFDEQNEIVVNADRAVAKALKIRAEAAAMQYF